MYHVANRVGRLLEVKLASPLSLEDVQQFAQQHVAITRKMAGTYVGVANLLEASVFLPEVAEALTRMLSGVAAQVERSAMLIGESAIFAMQVERVIRNANSPNRRTFRDAGQLVAWLSEVLTPAEQRQLEQFLLETTGQ